MVLVNRLMLTRSIGLMLAAIVILAMAAVTTVNGQRPQQGYTVTTFDSITDGFRAQVPNGWVVEDINSTDPSEQQYTSQYGVEYLAIICPQNQALPVIGGLYSCPLNSPKAMGSEFYRFVDLHSRPELEVLARQNKSITTSDLLALYIDYERKTQAPALLQYIEIVNSTDTAVNVTDPQTNQTIGTVPAKYVEWTHPDTSGSGSYKEFVLLVLSNDTNTGYVVDPIMDPIMTQAPAFVRQIFDSFELLATPPTPIAAATARTTAPSPPLLELQERQPSPLSQQPQPEQQDGQRLLRPQNQGDSVSIVPGSSSLTDTAFQPNPLIVSVGDTVTWTNDDTQPHTVTSGVNAQPDGKFDSSPNFNPLLAPGQTFEHTFTEAGQYPYYCALHPNMVGTVSVS